MQRKWVCQKCGQVRAISGGPKPDATRCVQGGTHVWKEENILVTSGIVIMVNNKVYSFQQIENLSKYKNKTIYS